MRSECEIVRALFGEALDDELDARARPAFAAHLSRCPRCRRAFEKTQRTLAVLANAPTPELPSHFIARTMARIKRERNRRQILTAAYTTSGVTVLVISLLALWNAAVAPALETVVVLALDGLRVLVVHGPAVAGAAAASVRATVTTIGALTEGAAAVASATFSAFMPAYIGAVAVILTMTIWARRLRPRVVERVV